MGAVCRRKPEAAGFQRVAQQLVIQQGTGLAQRRRHLRWTQAGSGGIDGRRLFHKTQGIAVHAGSGRGTGGRCKKEGTVRLLTRAKIAIERMVQQTPAAMDEVAPGRQHMDGRRVGQEAGKGGRRQGRPHAVRAKLRPGMSEIPRRVEPHTWIVGQQDERHKSAPMLFASVIGRGQLQSASGHVPLYLRVSVSLSPSVAPEARSHMVVIRVSLFLEDAQL